MRVDAFFEGGGILGISFIGAVKALSEYGYTFDRIGGISSGSIIASLLVSGYHVDELIELMRTYDFSFFKQKTAISKRNYIGKPLSLLYHKGIYDSSVIEEWVKMLLLEKGVETFEDVTSDGESQLKVMVTDFTSHKLMILPDDLETHYGIDPDYFSVAHAVRMSCAIPFFYTPVELPCKGQRNIIVDGGVIKNVPTSIIYKDRELKKMTLRFKIRDEGNKIVRSLSDLRYYFYSETNPNEKWIVIPNESHIKATNFSITKEEMVCLYKQGYKATLKFITEMHENV